MNTKVRNIYRKSAGDFLRAAVMPLAFTGIITVMIISGLYQAGRSADAESLRILEQSIRRAVVMNYAIEGRYPESISYIQSRYGIHIDDSKYAVHYRVIASNIMPEIMIIEIGDVSGN